VKGSYHYNPPRPRLTIRERAELYLAKCEPAISGSGGHDTTFRVACALIQGLCVGPEEAYQLLRDFYNPTCSPPWSEVELRHKVQDACVAATGKPRGYLLGIGFPVPPPPPSPSPSFASSAWSRTSVKATYDPDYLQEFTSQLIDTVDPEYLELRSEFSCHNRSPAGFLHKIFTPDESVWITYRSRSREGLIWRHDGPAQQDLSELNHLQSGRPGVWFLSNPIDGAPHAIERLRSEFNPEGISFRATECITDWRHVVVETDCAPEALWLKALALLELPVSSIYHSGARGPHALLNLGAASLQEWHAALAPHLEHLVKLGACAKTLTPLRLTRLPNCVREETGRLQQLFYLAPNADGTPIAARPLREDPLAVWMRYLAAAHFGPSDND
jgi:hypothetical protein